MHFVFNDNGLHKKLAPFSLTRPVAEIRFGILTIKESWELFLGVNDFKYAFETEAYLTSKFPSSEQISGEKIIINGNIKPNAHIAKAVLELNTHEELIVNGISVAKKGDGSVQKVLNETSLVHIERPWHIFQRNAEAIQLDFELLTQNRESQVLSSTNRVTNAGNVFVEPGAKVEHAILNAENGPIYIGKNAEVMEGSIIRGPFALCSNGVVKMGAKIYGPSTIGPYCKVGGEVSNCVFQAYSNKGHDGFLGNSVVGEWCNFGADTNSSNLKNNYSNVKIYNYESQSLESQDVLFCGVLMGDHSKTGINTMLNTATIVGVSANIFGGGFPPKHIPSFTWGGVEKTDRFILKKAFEVAESMMARRKIELTSGDKAILTHLYEELA